MTVDSLDAAETQQIVPAVEGLPYRSSAQHATHMAAVSLPILIIVLSTFTWFGALLKSSFLADDFQQMAVYGNPHNVLDFQSCQGQFACNIFWTVGTAAFGSGSAIPYLLLDSSIFATGLWLWLSACRGVFWPETSSWWVAALLLSNGAWMAIVLWSANSTHAIGLLTLGAGMYLHRRALWAETLTSMRWWSLAVGGAWTLLVASDGLYVGALPLWLYCAWAQWRRAETNGARVWERAVASVWHVAPAMVYFAVVSYPDKTSVAAYAGNSLRYIRADVSFYLSQMAPNHEDKVAYGALLFAAVVGTVGALRFDNLFPAACVLSAAIMMGIVLTEAQQRYPNYTVIPLLLVLSAGAAGWASWLGRWLHGALRHGVARALPVVVGAAVLLVVFRSGAGVRYYFSATPYGTQKGLATFREELSTLVPVGSRLCVVRAMPADDAETFETWMSGASGFVEPPIDAGGVYYEASKQACPATTTVVIVGLSPHGDFRAIVPSAGLDG